MMNELQGLDDFEEEDAFFNYWDGLTETQLAFLERITKNTGSLQDAGNIFFAAGWEAAKQGG